VTVSLESAGHKAWQVGVMTEASEIAPYAPTTQAKGVSGGAVALVGDYRN